MGQPSLPCGPDGRICHGMGEMLLQAGVQPQHIRLALPSEGNNLRNHRTGMGQSAGFVKDHRICLGPPILHNGAAGPLVDGSAEDLRAAFGDSTPADRPAPETFGGGPSGPGYGPGFGV